MNRHPDLFTPARGTARIGTTGPTSTPAPATRAVMALLTWLAVYPTLTAVLAVAQPLGLLRLPLALRTLALTLFLVPTTSFLLLPLLLRLRATSRWSA